MRQFFGVLFLLLFIISGTAFAQSDDITTMGSVSPLFYLENAFREEVLTASGEKLAVEVSSIVVEAEQVLIRFFISDLSEAWRSKITDEYRLYGSYLPVAELVTDDGSFLTPSSASRYSLLEFNGRLILGGLMCFKTDKTPQAFYINFNQIPFDTRPLSEGFTKAVILSTAPAAFNSSGERLSDTHNGLEFTLTATAQTAEASMLQPAVRMERADELFSKFGWITISDTADGKRFTVTRGNLYGFNLADDTEYSPAHAYVFAPVMGDSPLMISMDHAYVVRSFDPARKAVIRLDGNEESGLLNDEAFHLKVTNVEMQPADDRIRLTIDSGGAQVADISFKFSGLLGARQPAVTCGIDPDSGNFACDMIFEDISFPVNTLTVEIDAIEYCKEGPWDLTWTPVPMAEEQKKSAAAQQMEFPYTSRYPLEKEQPPEVQSVLENLGQCSTALLQTPGWIRESYELDYQFTDDSTRELIGTDQFANYLTHYITDTWYHAGEDSKIHEILTMIRQPESGEIISAQLQKQESSLDLIHALFTRTDQAVDLSFSCFADFRDIARSSALFLSGEGCEGDGTARCLNFVQSLSGQANDANSQYTTFRLDPDNSFIRQETIRYARMALILTKTTLNLEKADKLPDDLLHLMDTVK